jgi:hypothetical protein
MALRQKMKSRRQPGANGLQGKNNKLVRRYVHTRGFSRLAGKMPQKKNPNYIKNRVLLFSLILILLIPGIYYSFN